MALSGENAYPVVQDVVERAVSEINAAGGIGGRSLRLIVKDNETSLESTKSSIQAFLGEGIVGLIGPDYSDAVREALPLIKGNKLVTVSGSSTAADLATADDGGFLFRNIPHDDFQGIAMAHYLTKVASPTVNEAALVYQNDSYGKGLAGSFKKEFEARGGKVTSSVVFEPGLTEQSLHAMWGQVVAAKPTTIVLVTFIGEAVKIIQHWDDSQELNQAQWFFTDAVKIDTLAKARPAALEGMRGTSPTHAKGAPFDEFAQKLKDVVGDDIETSGISNYYDGVYLLALALALQVEKGQALGQDGLREAIMQVATPGQGNQKFRASQWKAALESLAAVDYDGASGPCDFDSNGEALAPYEVWKIVNGAFQSEVYLEPSQLIPGGK